MAADASSLHRAAIDAPVKVADTLRYLMYHECYNDSARAQALYGRLRPEQRQLDDVDFTAATAACPQGVDIATRMKVAHRALEVIA